MITKPERIQKIVNPYERRKIQTLSAMGHTLSFGSSVIGYDVRVEFGIGLSKLVMAPGHVLASTFEHFSMPTDVYGVVYGRSTWVRLGLAVTSAVIEPGWRGHLTLGLTNHSARDIVLRVGDPIAQIIFHDVGWSSDGYDGKYQDQRRGPVPAS